MVVNQPLCKIYLLMIEVTISKIIFRTLDIKVSSICRKNIFVYSIYLIDLLFL